VSINISSQEKISVEKDMLQRLQELGFQIPKTWKGPSEILKEFFWKELLLSNSLWGTRASQKPAKNMTADEASFIRQFELRKRGEWKEPPSTLSVPSKKGAGFNFHTERLPFMGRENILLSHVRVLPQGQNECGQHALKNGLVALGCYHKELTREAFGDVSIFRDVKNALFIRGATEDASIAQLTQLWEDLVHSSLNPSESLNPTFEKMLRVVPKYANSISMLVYESSGISVSSGTIGGDVSSLQYVANLFELKRKLATLTTEEPFRHVFLMGERGHWLTLVLRKDKQNDLKWFGFDSGVDELVIEGKPCIMGWCENNFSEPVHFIERTLLNLEQFADESYRNILGEELERKKKWFGPNGEVSEENRQVLLRSKDENLRSLKYAIDFFKRSGWTNKSHGEAFSAVRSLVDFYKNNDFEQNPIIQESLSVVNGL
jgi:hypothetical protein